ncbi:ORF6N domain-containing protein [Pantoea piersonii]|uniref:ORF6N domain-containing protein n=1 Tax=Pantoea piersonii TaxID=2364647 RepID=UPI00289A1D81|nr:ORF6N domain-containing protein [Pantoea piersonii]
MPNQVLGADASGVNPVVISSNASVSVPVLMYRDQRVITTELLARGYGTDEANVRKNLSRNAGRFLEGVHIFTVEGDDLRDLRVTNSHAQISSKARSLTLWTEKGAARMSKIVDTDEAWTFFERLEESYFHLRDVHGVMLPDMNDPIKLARAWADAMEAKQQAEVLTHRQAQYIDHLENLFSDGLSPVQFCKRLNGVNVSKVSAFLQDSNWLYDDNPNGNHAHWRVRSQARDKYLTEKSSQINPSSAASFTSYQPVLLREGAVWLYRRYLKGQLPMKQSWNGEYTHDKELAGNA